MSAFERVLDRLGARVVRHTATHAEAHCPAHPDRRESLNIDKGADRVLLHCFAGCSIDAIVAQLGMTPRELFDSSEAAPSRSVELGEIVASYEYGEGDRRYRQIRYHPKDFRIQHWEAARGDWAWGKPHDDDRRLYHEAALADVPEDGAVLLVEGEKDVHTLEVHGFHATTIAQGANATWFPQFTDALRQHHVILVPDHDVPGRAFMERAGRALAGTAASLRWLDLSALPEHGDVSDWFAQGGTREAFERLLAEAPPWRPVTEDSPEPEPPGSEPLPVYFVSAAELAANPAMLAEPEFVVPKVASRGRTTILSGREKFSGKSTFVAAGAAALTRGADFLGQPTTAGRVLWVGVDEPPQDTLANLIRFGADLTRVRMCVAKPPPPEIVAVVAAEVEAFHPDLVVIDALATFTRGLVRESRRDEEWTELFSQLTPLVRRTHCALVIIHHVAKTSGEYRDSTAIGASADYLLTLTADPPGSATRAVAVLGRRSFPDYTIRLDGNRFTLGTAAPSLEVQALTYIRSHPGTSQTAIVANVGGRTEAVCHALTVLEAQGHVEDRREQRGGQVRHHYFVVGYQAELLVRATVAAANPILATADA